MLGCAFLLGCGEHSSDSIKPQNSEFDFGKSVNQSIKIYLTNSSESSKKLQAYRPHEPRIVTGANQVVTNSSKKRFDSNLIIDQKILRAIYHLVEKNTLPQMTNSTGKLVAEVSQDTATLQAISDFANTRNGADIANIIALCYKFLNHNDSEELWQAVAQLIAKNPDLLSLLAGFLHDALICLPENSSTAQFFEFLTQNIKNWEKPLGQPVWLARLDKNSNPRVLSTEHGLLKPFVDQDNDGICDTDEQGHPIDNNGKILDIPAFSNLPYYNDEGELLIVRDNLQRAITKGGQFIFEYYDAKTTVFSILLYEIGQALQAEIPEQALDFITLSLGKKIYAQDPQGGYWGYSLESPGIKGMLQTVDLLKKSEVQLLLQGFAQMLQMHDPAEIAMAFQGVFSMIFDVLRDNPNINSQEDLSKWFEGFADNPPEQIFPLLQLMYMTPMPEPYQNMAMVLFYFISTDYPQLAEKLWPMIEMLREIKATNPGLSEKLCLNTLGWAKWLLISKVEIKDEYSNKDSKVIGAYILEKFNQKLLEDPENYVNQTREYLEKVLPSRKFVNLMGCLNNFCGYSIFKQAAISFLSPNADITQDVYSEIIRVHVGIMECRQSVVTNVRLLKLLAKFIDPESPLMINLLTAFQELTTADKELAILQILRNAFTPSTTYKVPPVALFGRAYLDVIRSTEKFPIQDAKIDADDVECILTNIADFLLNPDGLLQRVYHVIQSNSREY